MRGPAGTGPVRGLHVGPLQKNVLVMTNDVCLLMLRDSLLRARLTNTEEGQPAKPAGGHQTWTLTRAPYSLASSLA